MKMKIPALFSCFIAIVLAGPMPKQVPRLTEERIVGGTLAEEGEFPYQVSLQIDNLFGRYHFCGGTILGQNSILTAAHCLQGLYVMDVKVLAGELSFKNTSGNEQEVAAKLLLSHEFYNSNTFQNDLGVVYTASPLTFNEFVQPTVLPPTGVDTINGTICTVTGWGATEEGGEYVDSLYKVDVPIVSDALCNLAYDGNIYFESMICAGETGKDSCGGDAGGPLVCGEEQIGIVSWGNGCGKLYFPGVYTQVSYYVDWIQDHTV